MTELSIIPSLTKKPCCIITGGASNKARCFNAVICESICAVLLEVHDAVNELTHHLQQINGGGEDAGIVRRLGGVELLLRELSPVYTEDEEVGEDSVFWRAVLGGAIEMEKRVEMLMGE